MSVDDRLAEMGLELGPQPVLPPGLDVPFEWVRVAGPRCVVSGHGPLTTEGAPAGPFGRVPDQVSLEQAQNAASAALLAMLGAIRRTIGSLERIDSWVTVNGFVQAEPGFAQTTAVINPVSELLVALYGDAGRHARTAIGVAALPLDLPVVITAECHLRE